MNSFSGLLKMIMQIIFSPICMHYISNTLFFYKYQHINFSKCEDYRYINKISLIKNFNLSNSKGNQYNLLYKLYDKSDVGLLYLLSIKIVASVAFRCTLKAFYRFGIVRQYCKCSILLDWYKCSNLLGFGY